MITIKTEDKWLIAGKFDVNYRTLVNIKFLPTSFYMNYMTLMNKMWGQVAIQTRDHIRDTHQICVFYHRTFI